MRLKSRGARSPERRLQRMGACKKEETWPKWRVPRPAGSINFGAFPLPTVPQDAGATEAERETRRLARSASEYREARTVGVRRLIVRRHRRKAKRGQDSQDVLFRHPIVPILEAAAESWVPPSLKVTPLE
jgi:hypothetical protein